MPALPAAAAEKASGEAFFGLGKVVQLHLTMDAKQFTALTPAGGGFGGFGGFKLYPRAARVAEK